MLKKLAAGTALALVLSNAAWADYEAGMTAYENANYFAAFQEFEASAEEGDTASQYMLGQLYADGCGTRQNYIEAHKWFNIAAAWGHDRAAEARRNLEGRMTSVQIAEAQRLAGEWEPAASAEAESGATYSVRNAQIFLNELGYNAGPEDGVIGSTTRSAIRAYQYDNGLTATGDLTYALFEQLEADVEAGDEGPSVDLIANVQSELRRRGYDIPVVSGTMDSQTRSAIRAYQTDSGLTVTGEASESLLARLRSAQGDDQETQRQRVRTVQMELNDLGYNAGPEDGVFGPTTRNAVRNYQADNGLPVTGEVTESLVTHIRKHGSDSVAEEEHRDLVEEIEQALADRGYEPGAVDGFVTAETESAIRTYQSDAGLSIDGRVDEELLANLEANDDDMSQRDLVRAIQEELNDKGYNAGPEDGVFGPTTRRAIVTYQSDANIEITGEASQRLLRHMRSSDVDAGTTVAAESEGDLPSAELIQQIEDELTRLGWDVGTSDGEWGSKSRSAATEFQVAINVEADGEPDTELLQQLRNSYRTGSANDIVLGIANQFLRALTGNE